MRVCVNLDVVDSGERRSCMDIERKRQVHVITCLKCETIIIIFGCFAGKKVSKAPKIQRLVTPLTLQRKRARIAEKKKRIVKARAEACSRVSETSCH